MSKVKAKQLGKAGKAASIMMDRGGCCGMIMVSGECLAVPPSRLVPSLAVRFCGCSLRLQFGMLAWLRWAAVAFSAALLIHALPCSCFPFAQVGAAALAVVSVWAGSRWWHTADASPCSCSAGTALSPLQPRKGRRVRLPWQADLATVHLHPQTAPPPHPTLQLAYFPLAAAIKACIAVKQEEQEEHERVERMVQE